MKVNELDDNLGIPARLAIVATLARGQRLTFTALGEQTGIADGNLHVQTRRLLDAGYLTAEPVRQGGRNATRFELAERGRLAFVEHVRRLREAVEGPFGVARGVTGEAGAPRPGDRSRVW
jgi:DNA-binding transcriptional ArsR family regulator